jgi:hypothetical protein
VRSVLISLSWTLDFPTIQVSTSVENPKNGLRRAVFPVSLNFSDAWIRISLLDIDLITVDACVVVASIDTYLKYAKAVGVTETEGPMARQDERLADWQTEEWPELIE